MTIDFPIIDTSGSSLKACARNSPGDEDVRVRRSKPGKQTTFPGMRILINEGSGNGDSME